MAMPILGNIELQCVQKIEVDGDQVLLQHGIPALEGDFLQGLGRRAAQITLTGVLTGTEAGDGLKTLRDKFRAAEPVSFVADITTATQVDQVLIEEMDVRELAGKPERFEYAFTLREFIPPPEPEEEPPEIEEPENPAEDIDQGVGILIVEVSVEDRPTFDFSKVTLTVRGTQEDGTELSRTLSNRTDNTWTEEEFPGGQYTVEAVATASAAITGSVSAEVRPGETTRVSITLRTGATIAKAFVIHFRFDKAFIEPCMRAVMRQVAQYAEDHPSEKLVIVGHTDKVGDATQVEPLYNQSLSERRGRSVFAYLTFGHNPQASLDEWNQLRQRRTPGQRLSINDTWGAYEYQFMLQDLGYYRGNIDGDHGPLTDVAIDAFCCASGLPSRQTMDDPTWEALIRAYLAQDDLQVPLDRFFPNCPGEILKWFGCGEESPLLRWGRPPRATAWRPFRRVEVLFVQAEALPCQVPQPDTFDLPQPGAVANGWCVGPTTPGSPRCCLITYEEPEGGDRSRKWWVQPAEPGRITAQGTTRFEGFPPQSRIEFRYVLIAPDGEFMDGEIASGPSRGEPQPRRVTGQSDDSGVFQHAFSYTNKPEGVYTMEIRGPYVVRLQCQSADAAKGNVVCRRLTTSTPRFDVTVTPRPPLVVNPVIELASAVVVVVKPHTNPARQRVTLRLDYPFCHGSATFTRSQNNIHFFTALTGGTEISSTGGDNVFDGAQLSSPTGVELFAQGHSHSNNMNDVQLTLTLTPAANSPGPPAGPAATATMTAVELTLDIHSSRPAPGVAPAPLPQPPAAPPPAGTATDKWYRGRFVQASNPSANHERTLLVVRQIQPLAFSGTLVLRQVAIAGNNVTGLTNNTQIFENEAGSPPPAIANPFEFNTGTIPATGRQFWIEGRNVSTNQRDVGFQLGIRDLENDGDRVAATVIQLQMITAPTAAAPAATFTRIGLWDNAFRADGTLFNEQNEADNFVGTDTRRFYIRVHDVSQRGAGHINAEWHAVDQHGNDFHAPANRMVTLVEDAANPGVFVSRALMMVTDDIDHNQNTHSGLPAGLPDAGTRPNRGQRNHRLRRVTMEGDIVARYRHPLAATTIVNERLPVFQRRPNDSRRRVPLQIYVLRVAPGGAGVILTAAGSSIWTTDLRVIRESYERIGIAVETVVDAGTPAADVVTVGGDSIVLIDPPAGVNPANVTNADRTALGTAFPAIANTIRLFFLGGIAEGAGGVARPDVDFAGNPAQGSAFTIQATGPYAAAHELGHILTDKSHSLNTGHFNPPSVPAGNRLHKRQNLMMDEFLGAERVNGPKRLWDAVDADGINQYTRIRVSHYTRSF